MKKTLLVVTLLSLALLAEIIVLYYRGLSLIKTNHKLYEELSSNNLIEDNKITLQKVKEEKETLKEEIRILLEEEVFSSEDAKQQIEGQVLVNTTLSEEIKSLEIEIENLESDQSKLEGEYNKLLQKQKEETVYITKIPVINQYPNYPTGCESVALTILLNYYGVLVTPDQIIEKLPMGETPQLRENVIYGGNPEKEFVGNPFSLNGFGVYEVPISNIANQYKDGIIIATGTNFDEILKVVKQGTPVMAWTSVNLVSPYISKSWVYEPTGETVYWKANEHAVVIVGYTKDKVIISDPNGGNIKYQSRYIFKDRYDYYGKKALYYK